MTRKSPSFAFTAPRLLLAALLLATGSCFGPKNANAGGAGAGFFLESVEWGRLVDVLDEDGLLVDTDVLIHHELEGDGLSYELRLNPVTEKESLVILQKQGTAGFTALFDAARASLKTVKPKALGDAPPYTLVARNAAVRLGFSVEVDPASVDFTTVQVLTGDPPVQTFTGRYVVKNEGGRGYVIFDPTVSAFQAAQGAIPQNAVGFPEAFDQLNANLRFRVPTTPDPLFGQPRVLTSLDGKHKPTIQDRDTEPFESIEGGREVLVRVARTGNENDPYSGFMLDNDRPSLLGVLDATIDDVQPVTADPSDTRRDLTYSIDEANCRAMTPKVGDVFEIGETSVAVVTDVVSSGDPGAYVVRALFETGGLPTGGTGIGARYTTRYAASDYDLQVCFLEFQPTPGQFPSIFIDAYSTVTVRFDEPINTKTMASMRTFVISSVEQNNPPVGAKEIETAWFRQVDSQETVGEYIDRQRGYDLRVNTAGTLVADSEYAGRVLFGSIESTDGDRAFTLAPTAGWAEINDNGFLRFTVALRDGAGGIEDLAGNGVDFTNFVAGNDDQPGFIVPRDINGGQSGGAAAVAHAGYFSLLGKSLDEDGDGLAEWGGQAYPRPGAIGGRVPSRFSRSADQTNQFIGARANGTPVTEPLNPAGAVVQNVYRPQDVGFSFDDPTEYNMGIEGMSWSPANGVVLDETFNDLSLSLSHATNLPDEAFNPATGLPSWPQSGLLTTAFDDNIHGFNASGGAIDEQQVFRAAYAARSVDIFTAGGTPFLPWPTFQSIYNWRDSGISQDYVGGANGSVGAPNQQYLQVLGLPAPTWGPEEVPSVGLPLLCRYRTYPQSNSLGLNAFQTTQMLGGSALPNFRVYSAGGQNGSGIWFQVRPDNPAAGGTQPTGGFVAGGGQTPTQGDTLIYWAQLDFVVRVSRAYTHWFDMGRILQPGESLGVVLEPDNADQPATTSIVVEFRGSVQVDHQGDPLLNPSPLLTSGSPFDAYGDHLGTGFGSVSTPGAWTQSFADLEGNNYKFFQMRATFIGNATLGVEPVLDAVGVAWKQ